MGDALHLGVSPTPGEAYDLSGRLLEVTLQVEEATTLQPELYQNRPNPFRGQTVIGFRLPEAGEATLRVHDVGGRQLYVRQASYAAGYHEVELFGVDLGGSGVLYYTLETAWGTMTRKMIRL